MLSSGFKCRNNGTTCPTALISAQSGCNMEESAFYLGNVGAPQFVVTGVK